MILKLVIKSSTFARLLTAADQREKSQLSIAYRDLVFSDKKPLAIERNPESRVRLVQILKSEVDGYRASLSIKVLEGVRFEPGTTYATECWDGIYDKAYYGAVPSTSLRKLWDLLELYPQD